jgi:hypothetical protein
MLAGLTVICHGLLLRMLLRLLDGHHLLLRKTLLAVGNLLLKVHHVDLAHSRIRLHRSHLGSIEPLCTIW